MIKKKGKDVNVIYYNSKAHIRLQWMLWTAAPVLCSFFRTTWTFCTVSVYLQEKEHKEHKPANENTAEASEQTHEI